MPFFLAPFFWANIYAAGIGVDLLALSCGLFAAAALHSESDSPESRKIVTASWLFLTAIIAPTILILTFESIHSPWHALREAIYLTSAWLVFRLCRTDASRLLSHRSWAILLVVTAHLYVAYALIQYFDVRFYYGDRLFPVWNIFVERFPGPLAQANWEGLFLLLTLNACYQRLVQNRYILWVWPTILSIAGAALTLGRATGILMIVLSVFYILMSHEPRKVAWRILLSVSIGLLIAYLIMTYGPTPPSEVLDQREAVGLLPRLIIWNMSWQLFIAHPWLGIGLGNFPAYGADALHMTLLAHPEWTEAAKTSLSSGHAWAHNTVMQFALELGLSGAIAMLALYFFLARKTMRLIMMPADLTSGRSQGIIGAGLILLHGLVSISALQPFFMVLCGLYIAAAASEA